MRVLVVIACLFAVAVAPEPDSGANAQQSPSWVLPLAPAGYGGPGVINPYSNVNPLNPMAAQMESQAAGQPATGTPQTQLGPAGTSSAPVRPSFVEMDGVMHPILIPSAPHDFSHEMSDMHLHTRYHPQAPKSIEDMANYISKRSASFSSFIEQFPLQDANHCNDCTNVPVMLGQCLCGKTSCPCEKKEFVSPEIFEDTHFRPAEVHDEPPKERGIKVNFVKELPKGKGKKLDVAQMSVLHPAATSLIEAAAEAPCDCPPVDERCVCRSSQPNYVFPEVVEKCDCGEEPNCSCKQQPQQKQFFFVRPDRPCGCEQCPCPPKEPQWVTPEIVERCECRAQPVCPCAGKF